MPGACPTYLGTLSRNTVIASDGERHSNFGSFAKGQIRYCMPASSPCLPPRERRRRGPGSSLCSGKGSPVKTGGGTDGCRVSQWRVSMGQSKRHRSRCRPEQNLACPIPLYHPSPAKPMPATQGGRQHGGDERGEGREGEATSGGPPMEHFTAARATTQRRSKRLLECEMAIEQQSDSIWFFVPSFPHFRARLY